MRIFVGENFTIRDWVYLKISVVEENPIALKVGAPPVKVNLPYGLSTIFSVPVNSKANTVVQLKLVSGSCPYMVYNSNNQEVVGAPSLTPAMPQAQITLPPSSAGTWPLVIMSTNPLSNCVYSISV